MTEPSDSSWSSSPRAERNHAVDSVLPAPESGSTAVLRPVSRATIASRLDLFDHRVPEEFYHYAKDPDALVNLIDNDAHAAERDRLAGLLGAWMERTKDPLLEVFRNRSDPEAREAFMKQARAEAEARKGKGKAGQKGKAKKAKQAEE